MNGNEVLKTRVSPEMKLKAKTIANREFLSEAAWLKRLVVREIQTNRGVNGDGMELGQEEGTRRPVRVASQKGAVGKPLFVRLRQEDRLLLDARAEARGMRPATYGSVLLRAHLRHLTPLPKDELLALKLSISELAAIGRNINQIAKVANEGGRLSGSAREEFRAMLKICEALRDNTKVLLKANETSWSTGHAEARL